MSKNLLNPWVYIAGDQAVGQAADMAVNTIFKHYPRVDCPMTVEERIRTNDACIQVAVDSLMEYGGGVKISTASGHEEIQKLGWDSANIVMRPMVGAYAILRFLFADGFYKKPCGVLRYPHGGIYDEKSFRTVIDEETGEIFGIVTQHINLSRLDSFAEIACQVAKQKGLQLILSSKFTICESEKEFKESIEKVLHKNGLVEKKDYINKLTDVAIADLPNSDTGGFLLICNNQDGDTASDVIDFRHGTRSMGSQVFCLKDGNYFSYEELPGGTAPDKFGTDLKGANFINPMAIIQAITSEIERLNPGEKAYMDSVMESARKYLDQTVPEYRSTSEMIQFIESSVQQVGRGNRS